MKRFLMLLIIAITCVSLFASFAEARRFGGGSSFGKQRAVPMQRQQSAPATAPATPAGNKWIGPLAGLAVGAGLMSMFSGGGMGGLGSMMGSLLPALLIGAVVMFLISRFKSAQQPTMQYVGASEPYRQPQPQAGFATSLAPSYIPDDFPVESFLRNAKASFIRLQAANDRKDINDVREYTTPEVFAEISLQMQERGNAAQNTEVLSIDAELLEVSNEADYTLASVRFTGQLRENNATIESVNEIWHVQKNLRDDKAVWLLAGIQQVGL
jgi:predicted lipid-binding transport protein (Tim44 family)